MERLELHGPWFKHPTTGKFVDAKDLPCDWCKTDPTEARQRHEGPHATWCVHFRESQRRGLR